MRQPDRPIVFGPGDKLAWLEAIAMHPEATDIDPRVGLAISNRIDKHTGLSVVSAAWIAKWIGRKAGKRPPQGGLVPGERSVQGSINRIKRLGGIEVAVGGGRHRANTYRPLIDGKPKPHGQPWGKHATYLTANNEVSGETSRPAAQNLTASRTKPHGQPCPLPRDSLNSSLRVVEDTAANDPLDPSQLRWLAVKRRIASRLNSGDVKSWIEALRLKRLSEHEAVLIARSQFHCSHIENGYLGDRILDAWKVEQPSIVRVLFVTDAMPLMRAAE